MTPLELIALLETECTVVDAVVLGGSFARAAIADALREIYPRLTIEMLHVQPIRLDSHADVEYQVA